MSSLNQDSHEGESNRAENGAGDRDGQFSRVSSASSRYGNNGYQQDDYRQERSYSRSYDNRSFSDSSYSRGYREYRVSPSTRPDGSERSERTVRPGFRPNAEAEPYRPPARREEAHNVSANSDERDVGDAWNDAEEVVPAAVEAPEREQPSAEAKAEPVSSEAASEVSNDSEAAALMPAAADASAISPVRKQPSQLSSAIEDTLSNLSFGAPQSGDSSDFRSRPMGRFAAAIARGGRGDYRPSYGYQRRPYDSRDGSDCRDYRSSQDSRDVREDYAQPSAPSLSSAASQPLRMSDESLSTIGSSLSRLRQELLIVNTKLEYIRCIKGRDPLELSASERERVAREPELIRRLDRVYERVDELDRKLEAAE